MSSLVPMKRFRTMSSSSFFESLHCQCQRKEKDHFTFLFQTNLLSFSSKMKQMTFFFSLHCSNQTWSSSSSCQSEKKINFILIPSNRIKWKWKIYLQNSIIVANLELLVFSSIHWSNEIEHRFIQGTLNFALVFFPVFLTLFQEEKRRILLEWQPTLFRAIRIRLHHGEAKSFEPVT